MRAAQDRGVSVDQVLNSLRELKPIPVTKQAKRRAAKSELDEIIKTRAARLLAEVGMNPEGHELDRNHLGRRNWVIVKAALDKKVNALVGRTTNERHKFTQADLDLVRGELDGLADEVAGEVLRG